MIRRFPLVLGLVAASLTAPAAAEHPPLAQSYFPPEFSTQTVSCPPGFGPPRKLISDTEAAWYPKHWRAAGEPSLYLASRAPGASAQRTYRFTWLPTFQSPVIIRIAQAGEGRMRLTATRLSGQGGYEPGQVAARVERLLTAREAIEGPGSVHLNRRPRSAAHPVRPWPGRRAVDPRSQRRRRIPLHQPLQPARGPDARGRPPTPRPGRLASQPPLLRLCKPVRLRLQPPYPPFDRGGSTAPS